MLNGLHGKRVLITGSTADVGLATAHFASPCATLRPFLNQV